MSKLSTNSKRILGVAAACLMLVGWSATTHARSCTIDNWEGGAVNPESLTAADAAAGNSRYAGPCSLAVDLSQSMSYVVDPTPAGAAEPSYIVRFYFNPNDNADDGSPLIIFAANDANDGTGDDSVQVWYNVESADPFQASAGALTVAVANDSGGVDEINFAASELNASGWNSIEIVWNSQVDASILASVNGGSDLSVVADTDSKIIESALLGYVGTAEGVTLSSQGVIFFDDFDSRRSSRPGRLLACDADSDGDLNVLDALSVLREIGPDEILAAGQPDCDEDGGINVLDALAILNLIRQ
ncbi:MAG: hypothetical protein ACLFQC_07250 [Wenzhouxiangella sp.]